MVRSSAIKLHNRETAIEVTREACIPRRLYAPPTPHTERGELLGLEQGCHHLSSPSGIVDIQQLLANLDTMSTLVSDTGAVDRVLGMIC